MEAVGQLTGGIAHDFNNLLAVIIGNLDLLQDGQRAADDADATSISAALGAANRGAELTHRLLAFARQQPLSARFTDVNEMIPGFTRLAERTLGEDIAIETRLASGLWPIEVDVGALENALLNIAINARDAMPDGGRVIIETANVKLEDSATSSFDKLVPGLYVMISLADEGTGMAPGVRARVFEPFFTTKEIGKGSGMGMSMVIGFANQSGGQVAIESREGTGTTVKIFLPKAEGKQIVAIAAEQQMNTRPTGTETILVVEDDVDVRKLIVTVLNRLGYTVLQAQDGPTAVTIMGSDIPIDLLLTDIIMPGGMTGLDVAYAFQETFSGAPVLFSSGYTREVLDSRGGIPEGIELINKPYKTAVLAHKLRELLDTRE